jgi:hypothetical protein
VNPMKVEDLHRGIRYTEEPTSRHTYTVTSVDTRRCRNHTHINDQACYDNGTTVYRVN